MRQSLLFDPRRMPPPPPPPVLVHDDDDNVGVCPNSDAINPQSRSPAAAVGIAVNVIHSPSISLRSCGTAPRQRNDVTADRGRHHRRHLQDGVTTTTGGSRTSSSDRATGVVHRPLMPSSKIHWGGDRMDRARHGQPPAAMATKTNSMTEECIVSPSTYHLPPQRILPNQAQGASPTSHR